MEDVVYSLDHLVRAIEGRRLVRSLDGILDRLQKAAPRQVLWEMSIICRGYDTEDGEAIVECQTR